MPSPTMTKPFSVEDEMPARDSRSDLDRVLAPPALPPTFRETSRIAQAIKTAMVESLYYPRMQNEARECLDLLASNMARIVVESSTDPKFWERIKTFAEYGRKACGDK